MITNLLHVNSSLYCVIRKFSISDLLLKIAGILISGHKIQGSPFRINQRERISDSGSLKKIVHTHNYIGHGRGFLLRFLIMLHLVVKPRPVL